MWPLREVCVRAEAVKSSRLAGCGVYSWNLRTLCQKRNRNNLTTHQLIRPHAGKVRIQAFSSCPATFQ